MNGKMTSIENNTKSRPRFRENKLPEKGYIGFCNLPNQLYHKISKSGTTLNLLIIGDSGSGCSTLINTLFNTSIITKKTSEETFNDHITFHTTEGILKEEDFLLKLRIVRVRGFGSLMDNTLSWSSITKCINDRFELYFKIENSLDRPLKIDDCRIHCCLYLLSTKLRKIDVLALKAIGDCVAVVPIVSKADTYMTNELLAAKSSIMSALSVANVRIYDFSHALQHVCEETRDLFTELTMRVPFAVIGGDELHEGVRGRKYGWGLVEVENIEHSDTHALRCLLLCVGLPGLLRYTEEVTYRAFRDSKLGDDGECVNSPISQLENEKVTMDLRLKEAERSMEEMFRTKVSQKMAKLKDSEASNETKWASFHDETMIRREKLKMMKTAFEKEYNEFVEHNPTFVSFRNKRDKKKMSTIKVGSHF